MERVGDRLAIMDLMARYAHAVDSKDWSAYTIVFTDEASIDYSATGGMKGSVREVTPWIAGALSLFSSTQHLLANHLIAFEDADTATAEVMVHNPMVIKYLVFPKPSFVVGAWYRVRCVKVDGVWRICKLKIVASHSSLPTLALSIVLFLALVVFLLARWLTGV